jgi:pimeloyl-ACP methyl ester carboxylesterase
MERHTNFVIHSTSHDRPIVTDVLFNRTNTPKPVVIFCHGYKGYKDWGAWNLAGQAFAENGIFFVKFNFSHNGGTLIDPIDFPDLQAFGENNYSIELADLNDVIEWIGTNDTYANEVDTNNITLIGHSRGGGIAALMASKNKKVSNIISWAGVSDFGARFPKGEELELWRANGVSYIVNARTNQKMPHLFQFYEDFEKNAEGLNIQKAVSAMNKHHLIIQGTDDLAVDVSEAENLHRWNPDSELVIMKGMNHTLGSTQPWDKEKMPEFLESAVDKSINFVLKCAE